jgi:putative selenium metabolism hydrolase
MKKSEQEIAQMARRLEPETIAFLADMVRMPSFSSKEKAVVDRIEREMRTHGFDEVRVDGLGNVIGRIGSGPRVIAFDAHVDTVEPGLIEAWRTDPFDPVIEGGYIHGRGTVDQEGGMASMVTAGRIIQALDLAGQLTVLMVGSVQEEDCDGLCWRYLIEKEGLCPELVVITEPTGLRLYRGQRGRMEIEITAKGLSCHGSAPERGDNAVYKIARIALELEKLSSELADDPFLGRGSLTVSQVRSTSPSLCAVPDLASLYIDRRLTAGETQELALEQVRRAAARAGVPGVEVSVPIYETPSYKGTVYPTAKFYPSWVLSEDSPYLSTAIQAYRDVLEREPEVGKWTFSTNGVAIAGCHGIPCIGMGPGHEELAHAPNECCAVEELTKAAMFYAALVAKLGG